jgi:hypothetical protein
VSDARIGGLWKRQDLDGVADVIPEKHSRELRDGSRSSVLDGRVAD